MSLTLRAGKGSPLTNAEIDSNFSFLNDSKLSITGGTVSGPLKLPNFGTTASDLVPLSYIQSNFVKKTGLATESCGNPIYLTYTIDNASSGNLAVNKSYVDNKIATSIEAMPGAFGVFLRKDTDDTMSGNLTLAHAPTLAGHAVRKDYVDQKTDISNFVTLFNAAYVKLSGSAMTGTLTLNADPDSFSNPLTATTKRYVDTNFIAKTSDTTITTYLSVPSPVSNNNVANKVYVDTVANLKVNKTGATLTGSLIFGGANGGAWNGAQIVLGSYYIWVDISGRLRIKNSAPTSDTDGTVVGSQV